MNIKEKYGVENLFFYTLQQITGGEGRIFACSTKNFDLDLGKVREYKTGQWKQCPLEGAKLKIVLKDLQKDRGKVYFLDTKTYYKSLFSLLKDYYILLSINKAISIPTEVKYD